MHRALLLASLFLLPSPLLHAQNAASASGHWQGKIQMPNQPLDMIVDLAKSPAGAWIGSVSFPGSTDVPLGNISVDDTSVRFTAALPGNPSLVGAVSADGRRFSGRASNAEGSVPFQLTRMGEASVRVPPPSSASSKEFEGAWEGAIEVDGNVRRILLKLSSAPDGTATATLVSVDKGNVEIPVTTVTLQDKQLHLDVRSVAGSYRGVLGGAGEIAGEWTEGATQLPLKFKRGAR